MKNIILYPPVDDIEGGRKHWALSNLSTAYRLHNRNSYMGKISSKGLAEFSTSTLPPEMFVKLTSSELKEYNDYWDVVEKTFNITVDRCVVDPVVDYQSGSSFVVRCHFAPEEADTEIAEEKLPALPYKLLPARECSDIWSFGQLLFTLVSSGRPLFPTNSRSGHLLDYKDVCMWDMDAAEAIVYEHVEDSLAQDILLRLLAPYERRAALNMESILNHPFFNNQETPSSIVQSIVNKRQHAREAYRRWLENNTNEKSEEGWLKERTVAISCWDFDFQNRIHLTPTALIPEMLSRPVEDLGMPCSFVVLPYKLVRNKRGVLTPPSKRDVERAERLGLKMLALSKACFFVHTMKRVVQQEGTSVRWTTAALWPYMQLPHEEFSDLQSRMASLAAQHVEKFRQDPVSLGLKLIQEKVQEILDVYDDSTKTLLYLVDEYNGVPIAGASAAPFPHQVLPGVRGELIQRALPFMYMCARYFRGVSGSAAGLVKLIFEAAAPHIPPSWSNVCKGLDNTLNHDAIVEDVHMLCEALADMCEARYSVAFDDDFQYMQNYIAEVDIQRRFAKLQRVSSGCASLWTSSTGVEEIREKARKFGFKEAAKLKQKTDLQLQEQDARIKQLEKELEHMRFRNELKLDVPDVDSPFVQSCSVSNNEQDLTSVLEMGAKCIEANVDLMDSAKTQNENFAGLVTMKESKEKNAPALMNLAENDTTNPIDDSCFVSQPSPRPFSEMAAEFQEILDSAKKPLESEDEEENREKPSSSNNGIHITMDPETTSPPQAASQSPSPRLLEILKNVVPRSPTSETDASSSKDETQVEWSTSNPPPSQVVNDTKLESRGSKEWNDILTPE